MTSWRYPSYPYLKLGTAQYRQRGIRFSILCKRAVLNGNEYKAEYYATLSAHCWRMVLKIEGRMLRHYRPVIRTIDSYGLFTYTRLVKGKRETL